MLLHLACHDPAHPSPNGDYWVWRSTALTDERLRDYYSRLASSMPSALETFAEGDLFGGCLALDTNECCFYRYYDGGRDAHGRPGRRVLLIGVTDRATALKHDAAKVLESDPFSRFERSLRSGCVMAAPNSLDPDIEVPELLVATPQGRHSIRTSYVGEHAVTESWAALSDGIGRRAFHWKVRRKQGEHRVEVEQDLQSARPKDQAPTARNSRDDLREAKKPVERRIVRFRLPRFCRSKTIRRFGLGVAIFVAGAACGSMAKEWYFEGITNVSPTIDLDREAFRSWLERHDPRRRGSVPTAVLLDRLERNDWTIPPRYVSEDDRYPGNARPYSIQPTPVPPFDPFDPFDQRTP